MFKKGFSIIAAVLVLLVTCVFIRAQDEQPTNGAISGRVINDRGEAMPGATISMRAIGAFNFGRVTTSDAEGNFRFSGLEPALYTFSVNSPAYVLQPPESGVPTPFYRIGDTVRFEMVKGGVITGTVTNAAGDPVIGIRVRAIMVRDRKGKEIPNRFAIERTTDDRGIYRIYGLGPGTYLVSAGGGGYQSSQFYPFETDVPTYSPSSTRDNAAEFAIRSGEETVADIRYRNEPGHTVSGTAKVGPGSGAGIVLVAADGGNMPGANAFQQPGARGFAVNGVADGEYYIYAQELMTAGVQSGSTPPNLSASDGKRITVKGADVTGIELIPKPLSVIAGVVSLESSKVPECRNKRKPLFSETLIEMQRHEKDTETIAPFVRGLGPASPDQKGSFTLRNIAPGRYRFSPRFYARYWYLKSITIGAPAATPTARTATPSRNDAAAGWTVIRSGELLSNLTFTLAEGAASIRGKITVAEGASIPSGMAVYLVPAERERVDHVLSYFVAQVASDGAFAFNNLPPGRYSAVAQNPIQSETENVVKLRMPESAEARTKLRRAAEGQKIVIELKPCQNLTDYQFPLK